VQRRLAALFCADVAGYTRLMNADEAATLRLLASHREMTDRLIPQYGGRIANTAGDSILAEFPSAVDALQCALGIQERIAAVHEEVSEERRVLFRIGLHVGEAMVRDGDLFGDGVNVAARMQARAEPGSVCLSGTAYEFVHRVLPMSFEDVGPQHVKNLDAPIRAYLARPPGQLHSRAIPPVHRARLLYLIRRLYQTSFKPLTEAARAEGLSTLDAPVLNSLADAPGIDQRQLAERVAIDLKKTRRIVRRLQQLGLIEMPTSAQNAGSLRLTEAGLQVREKLLATVIAVEDHLMATLSETEREVFRDIAARVIKTDEFKATDRKN
jgi:class 3 adenylate cyclase/DNA-binding MarR family transcriptional regulator